MPGRKPTPTVLKLVKGNPGKRPINVNEPRPESDIPAAPDHLPDGARSEWARLAPELAGMGLLTGLDRAAFAAYCVAYADWVEAEDQLRRYGKVVKSPLRTTTRNSKGTQVTETSGGFPMQSPFLAIRNRALETMHKFLTEFGMTPASRSRINVEAPGTGHTNPKDRASNYF